MNILIKLTCLIGLVIAPILGQEMPEATTPVIDEVTLQSESIDAEPISEEVKETAVPQVEEVLDEEIGGAGETANKISSNEFSGDAVLNDKPLGKQEV